MASLDDYMIQIPADEWSLLGFLIFRKRQDDFSGIKDKEHYRFQMSLLVVQSCDIFTTVKKAKATYCLNNFKSKLITLENKIKISQKKKNLLVERVALQHKRPAEEVSLIITTPSNLRIYSLPLFYNNEDNSFGNYNKESNEVEDASTEAFPDEINILTSEIIDMSNHFTNLYITFQDKEGVELNDLKFTDFSILNESKKYITEKIIIDHSSNHDWIMNEYNISEDFHEFQTQTVEQLKYNPFFSYATEVDKILCLSSIMYVKEDKPDLLTSETLPVIVKLMILEYSE
ncbi:1811_t:CDS:2, partial [Funneliformis caledonium]